ncbi:hypothetical protein CASFOL_035252 [Castilleja foliolosa]|uniref:TIR domain-containing protein n=1 Tax=Castilleja foliolosa TaxID=1961234 RepID=A0ABD3BS24_9LAMI
MSELKTLDPNPVISNNGNGNHPNATPFKIFISYDPREDLAYEVCRHSLLKRSSVPIEIIPIKQHELRENGVYWRERGKLKSTDIMEVMHWDVVHDAWLIVLHYLVVICFFIV